MSCVIYEWDLSQIHESRSHAAQEATQENTHKKTWDELTSHVTHRARSYADKLVHTEKKMVAK